MTQRDLLRLNISEESKTKHCFFHGLQFLFSLSHSYQIWIHGNDSWVVLKMTFLCFLKYATGFFCEVKVKSTLITVKCQLLI